MENLKDRYVQHRRNAKIRGVSFNLTFYEWLKLWTDSGHLHERGYRRGQYVMARLADKGPYAVGNVRIIKVEDNHREKTYRHTNEAKAKMSEAKAGVKHPMFGKKHSPEMIAKFSAAKIGNQYRRGIKKAEIFR